MNGGVSSGVAQFDLGGVSPVVALPSSLRTSNSPGPHAAVNSATVFSSASAARPRRRARSPLVSARAGGAPRSTAVPQPGGAVAEAAGQVADRVGALGRHVAEHSALPARDGQGLRVGDPVCLLVLVAPDLEADVLERVVPGVAALVVEPLGAAVDEDPAGVAVDH